MARKNGRTERAPRGSGHCILGGTFTYMHDGHLKLLAPCRSFRKITIGLTSNEYVRRHKIYPSFPYAKRLAGLKSALKKMGLLSRTEIVEIGDEQGVAHKREDADTIIVSDETLGAAKRINAARKRRGLKQLHVISIPLVYGEDLKKISCLRIYRGETDLHGRLKAPLRVQVATDNPTKLKGAGIALKRAFGKKFILAHHAEDSRVSAHPFNRETFTGAKNRAVAAWKRANASKKKGTAAGKDGCDYSLGIESGLFSVLHTKMHIDITVACVYDGKKETYGTGMGFVVPEHIAHRIIAKKSDLSAALKEITGIEKIGWREGALGWFSDGVMHRSEQIEAAVACAFVPRIAEAKKGMKY
ncbi:Phosphopantetheine adenylyltransferase [uncultured archaeon]|nr:Phosphopantetheine adenylyltransferase [uncultured archaeon]